MGSPNGSATLPRRVNHQGCSTDEAELNNGHSRRSRSRTVSESDTTNTTGRTVSPLTTGRGGLERHASQAIMWYTTVPQSLVNQEPLGSRHKPTKRSLRHSRMIGLNRGKGRRKRPSKYLPPVIERHKLGTCLAAAQFLLGAILVFFAVWLMFWAPHLSSQDLSFYSGLPLCASGWIAILLLRCCRYQSPEPKHGGGCRFPVRSYFLVLSVGMAILAGCACVAALAAQSYHLFALYMAIPHCLEEPYERELNPDWLKGIIDLTRTNARSCVCDRSLMYQGMPCFEVKSQLPFILTALSALNFMSFFVAAWYAGLILVSKSRRWRHHRRSNGGDLNAEEAASPMIGDES